MERTTITERGRRYLVYSGDLPGDDSFEEEMLRRNRIPGLIAPLRRETDGTAEFLYEITGCVSLAEYLEERTLRREEIAGLVRAASDACAAAEGCLLLPEGLCLSPEETFMDEASGEVRIPFLPGRGTDPAEGMRAILKNILAGDCAGDEDAAFLGYELFRAASFHGASLASLAALADAEGAGAGGAAGAGHTGTGRAVSAISGGVSSGTVSSAGTSAGTVIRAGTIAGADRPRQAAGSGAPGAEENSSLPATGAASVRRGGMLFAGRKGANGGAVPPEGATEPSPGKPLRQGKIRLTGLKEKWIASERIRQGLLAAAAIITAVIFLLQYYLG
ncbi:MAG: hypothetical protein IJL66_00330 [Lachnospiraceae bacterium]|nr:hypothetical protein [Lachnospiraceae bacterium]